MFGRRLHQSTDERLNVAAGAVLGQLVELQRVRSKCVVEQGGEGGEDGGRGKHAVHHLAEGPHVTGSVVNLNRASRLINVKLRRHVLRRAFDCRQHLRWA